MKTGDYFYVAIAFAIVVFVMVSFEGNNCTEKSGTYDIVSGCTLKDSK